MSPCLPWVCIFNYFSLSHRFESYSTPLQNRWDWLHCKRGCNDLQIYGWLFPPLFSSSFRRHQTENSTSLLIKLPLSVVYILSWVACISETSKSVHPFLWLPCLDSWLCHLSIWHWLFLFYSDCTARPNAMQDTFCLDSELASIFLPCPCVCFVHVGGWESGCAGAAACGLLLPRQKSSRNNEIAMLKMCCLPSVRTHYECTEISSNSFFFSLSLSFLFFWSQFCSCYELCYLFIVQQWRDTTLLLYTDGYLGQL